MGRYSFHHLADVLLSPMIAAVIVFFISEIYLIFARFSVGLVVNKSAQKEKLSYSIGKRLIIILLINAANSFSGFLLMIGVGDFYLNYGFSKVIIFVSTIIFILSLSLGLCKEFWSNSKLRTYSAFIIAILSAFYIFSIYLIYKPISNFVYYYEEIKN